MSGRTSSRNFKDAISTACNVTRLNHRQLCNKTGLDGFLIECDFTADPKDIAADALDQLCNRDALIFDRTLCLAIVEYLDSTIGPPSEDKDRFMRMSDLKAVLLKTGVRDEYRKWAASWYD